MVNYTTDSRGGNGRDRYDDGEETEKISEAISGFICLPVLPVGDGAVFRALRGHIGQHRRF